MKLPVIYFKANQDEYGIFTKGGNVKKQGQGIGGWINPSMTSVSLIKMGLRDTPFNLTYNTQDTQPLTLNGTLQYKVDDPQKLADQFSYIVDAISKEMLGDGVEKLNGYLIGKLAKEVRGIVQAGDLEDLLVGGDEIQENLQSNLEGEVFANLGLEFNDVQLLGISTDRKIQDALSADYRESLLTKQQGAEYDRRAAAVKAEQTIATNEMRNKIALAKKRGDLIGLERDNAIAEANYLAECAKLGITAFDGIEPDKLRSYALLKMGENATGLGSLTLGHELLRGN